MYSIKSVLLVVIFSMGLIGCGSEDYNADPSYYPNQFESVEKELRKADFKCESTSKCPENVGLIYAKHESYLSVRVSQCTGFLIADNIVATNSHCIPENLKGTYSSDCSESLSIRFKNKAGDDHIFNCQKMIVASDHKISDYEQDYAFFTVSSTGIAPIKINKSGALDNQLITIKKVTPLSYGQGGRLQVNTCKAGHNSMLNPSGANQWSKVVSGLDCNVRGGNSGSPVLNSSGDVIGIVQATILDGFTEAMVKKYSNFDFDVPYSVGKHMLFTNMACVDDPVKGMINQEICEASEKITMFSCLQTNDSSVKASWQSWEQDLDKSFVYKLAYDSENLGFKATPVCVKDSAKTFNFRQVKLGVTLKVKLALDSGLKIKNGISLDSDKDITYLVSLGERSLLGNSTVSMILNSWDYDLESLYPRTESVLMAECTDEQIESGNLNVVVTEDGESAANTDFELIDGSNENQLLCDGKLG